MPASATKIAVPIVDLRAPLRAQERAARVAGADLIELRVDLIDDVAAVETYLAGPRELPAILTIRSAAEGGAWDGSDADRVALFERLGLLLPGYIDIELASWRRSANLRQKLGLVCARVDHGEQALAGSAGARPKNALIISHHDFRTTPSDLARVFDELLETPAEIIKAVFQPADSRDAVRILTELRRAAAQRPTIALGLGEAGLATRVLAAKLGGFLTFATLEADGASAPGQPTLATLCERYRFRDISAQTAVFGVLGWPVGHSRSPQIHNAAMRTEQRDGVYLPLPVQPERLDAFLDEVAAQDWLAARGLSVTLPHKEAALEWVARRGGVVTAVARRVGAANTLTRESDGAWEADNTDVAGVVAALRSVGWSGQRGLSGCRAIVFGAGGVARAVCIALRDAGATVAISNRTRSRAEKLAAECGGVVVAGMADALRRADLLVNCTSLGMSPDVDQTPAPGLAVGSTATCFDTVYMPRETRFLREAAACGARTITGIEMFLGQAAAQFARWHGVAPSVEIFRAALEAR